MRRFFIPLLIAACSIVLPATASAEPLKPAIKHDRPTITTALQGKDLIVTVHNVTDYCRTDADTEILRTSDSIRILRARPSKVASSCFDTQDLSFVVKDVSPGRYVISYERMPLVAPARPRQVATATTVISS